MAASCNLRSNFGFLAEWEIWIISGIVIDYGYYPSLSSEVMGTLVMHSFKSSFFSHCTSSLKSDENATVFAPAMGVPIHWSTEEGVGLRSAPASVHWTPVTKPVWLTPNSIYHFFLTPSLNSRDDDSPALSDGGKKKTLTHLFSSFYAILKKSPLEGAKLYISLCAASAFIILFFLSQVLFLHCNIFSTSMCVLNDTTEPQLTL